MAQKYPDFPSPETTGDKTADISVVLSVYGNINDLTATINSVCRQTADNFEIVLVDDGNCPADRKIIAAIAGKDNRIRLIRNQTNIGLAASLVKGIKSAGGKYIARIDNGDIMVPGNRLKTQFEILENDHNLAVVSGGIEVIDFLNRDRYKSALACIKHDDIIKLPPYKTWLEHVTVMFRKEMFFKSGGYNKTIKYSEDTELWPRMLKVGKALVMPEIWAIASMQKGSISVAKNNHQILVKIKMLIAEKKFIAIIPELIKLIIPKKQRVKMRYRKNFIYLGKIPAQYLNSLTSYEEYYRSRLV